VASSWVGVKRKAPLLGVDTHDPAAGCGDIEGRIGGCGNCLCFLRTLTRDDRRRNVDFRDGDQGIWVEIDIYLAPPRWNEEGGKKSRFKKVGLWILSRERVRNRVQRQPNRGWLSRIDTKSSTGGRGWRARLLAKVGERETRNSECIFG
jgi:hypothetical protein